MKSSIPRPGGGSAGPEAENRPGSFIPLYATNFFGTLNDNFLKTLAALTVIGWLPDGPARAVASGAAAGALVLPYIFCSPLADRLAAVWPKCRILRWAKFAELPIVAVAIAGFALRSPWIVFGAVLLMGLQSSLYSPAKYALVRDIGGEGRISTGMGGMEGVSFLGVLLGTVAGAAAADPELVRPDWHVPYFALALFACAGCRQKDVRDFTVDVPALVQEKEAEVSGAIRAALVMCSGVDMASIQFDAANHRVTLKYDSMQTAKKNIEMAIAKAGYAANGVTPESIGVKAKGQ